MSRARKARRDTATRDDGRDSSNGERERDADRKAAGCFRYDTARARFIPRRTGKTHGYRDIDERDDPRGRGFADKGGRAPRQRATRVNRGTEADTRCRSLHLAPAARLHSSRSIARAFRAACCHLAAEAVEGRSDITRLHSRSVWRYDEDKIETRETGEYTGTKISCKNSNEKCNGYAKYKY